MAEPTLVADCVAAMKGSVKVPVTVKCRIGIDEQNPEEALFAFTAAAKAARVDALIVHARKAWLKGLSPRENREVPPLDYALVRRLKAAHPDLKDYPQRGSGERRAGASRGPRLGWRNDGPRRLSGALASTSSRPGILWRTGTVPVNQRSASHRSFLTSRAS